jgi:GTPase SAR1 family protein
MGCLNYLRKNKYETYIRDCYYRLITEIFFQNWDNVEIGYHKFVVTGNPGVGKSSLMFLFIRVLLELGVKVLAYIVIYVLFVLKNIFHFCKLHSLRFALTDGYLFVYESTIIPHRSEGKDVVNDPIFYDLANEKKICEGLWNPTTNFVCDRIKERFKELKNINSLLWIIVDEFSF